jgi:predicted transcriptional regulator
MSKSISKKFGGQDRAEKARKKMSEIFSDPEHPLYLEKDIDLATKFDVSRLTIYSIREELGIKPRTDRIIAKLKKIDTKKFTKKELAAMLGLKYQNLYKILRESNIRVKADIPPIVSMIKSQREKKNSTVKQTP